MTAAKNKKVIVVDCGSTFTRSLIDAISGNDRVPILVPDSVPFEEIASLNPCAIVISGSGWSVNHKKAPRPDVEILRQGGIPVLGICYGLQYMVHVFDGIVKAGYLRESGITEIYFRTNLAKEVLRLIPPDIIPTLNHEPISSLYKHFHSGARVWMSHVCQIIRLPAGFVTTAVSQHLTVASIERGNLFGVHFHPEKQKELSKEVGNGDLILESFFDLT